MFQALSRLFLVVTLAAVSCGGATAPQKTPDPVPPGRYSIQGGGGALEAVNALKDAFTKLHPGVTWAVEDIGSDAGVQLTAAGTADLGMISRDLKDAEKGKVETLSIGVSGTGMAVNSVNPVKNLTKDQVKAIYSGSVSDWAALGGQPGKITVLIRETGAATRSAFESFFFDGKPTYGKDVIEVFEIEETIKAIKSFKDAIGMVSIDNRTLGESSIRLLSIDGVAASRENLNNGTYKIRRPLYLVYHPTTVKPAIQAFLEFVRSPEGQRIIVGR